VYSRGTCVQQGDVCTAGGRVYSRGSTCSRGTCVQQRTCVQQGDVRAAGGCKTIQYFFYYENIYYNEYGPRACVRLGAVVEEDKAGWRLERGGRGAYRLEQGGGHGAAWRVTPCVRARLVRVRTALKKVDAKRELLRTKRRMSQMMQLPSDDADTNSESLPRTCPRRQRGS
jgi:hypothetical protein